MLHELLMMRWSHLGSPLLPSDLPPLAKWCTFESQVTPSYRAARWEADSHSQFSRQLKGVFDTKLAHSHACSAAVAHVGRADSPAGIEAIDGRGLEDAACGLNRPIGGANDRARAEYESSRDDVSTCPGDQVGHSDAVRASLPGAMMNR